MKPLDNNYQANYQQYYNRYSGPGTSQSPQTYNNASTASFTDKISNLFMTQDPKTGQSSINSEMLLNLAFTIINQKDHGGFVGWLQDNSATINGVVRGVQFARQLANTGSAVATGTSLASGAANSSAGLASGATSATSATPTTGTGAAGTAATYLGYAAQAYGAYKILSSDAPDDVKAQALAKQAALYVADCYTFGLASVVNGTLGQTKEWQRIEKELIPYDPYMQGAASIGRVWGGDADVDDYLTLATSGTFAPISKALGISFNHKSTKEYQAERAQSSFQAAVSDIDKKYVQDCWENKQTAASDNIIRDPSNPYDGKEWKWEEQKPLMKGENVWGMAGFGEAFPDFISGYTEDQRRSIAQAALDHDLLSSHKGDIIFSGDNMERIQQIAVEIKAGTYVPITPPPAPEPAPAPTWKKY